MKWSCLKAKGIMNSIKKQVSIALAMMFVHAVFAAPTVSNVKAKQRYPWNGMVDITCTVSGISGTTQRFEFAVDAMRSGNIHQVSQFWVVKNGMNSTDRVVRTNETYHLVWDSTADFDNQICSNMVMRVNLVDHGKVQLWANGPYWATTNIGAERPEDYGYYFWWGDTVGYKRENNAWMATDGSSSNFSFNTRKSYIPTYGKTDATLKSEGWISTNGVLMPGHDAAHVQWGGNWRMPTKQELDDLNNNCYWIWTTMNGVNGCVIRGRGDYASASIFLPAAGYGDGPAHCSAGSSGSYWSSVPYSDGSYYYAWYLGFNSSSSHFTSNYDRDLGRSVRPVQGFSQ